LGLATLLRGFLKFEVFFPPLLPPQSFFAFVSDGPPPTLSTLSLKDQPSWGVSRWSHVSLSCVFPLVSPAFFQRSPQRHQFAAARHHFYSGNAPAPNSPPPPTRKAATCPTATPPCSMTILPIYPPIPRVWKLLQLPAPPK